MAPRKPTGHSSQLQSYDVLKACMRTTKKGPGKRSSTSGLKRRNGLLNTAVSNRSEAMNIAKRNSIESRLFRLPGEIRNKIWKYTLGDHRIEIGHRNHKRSWPIGAALQVYPLHPTNRIPHVFIRPSFALPLVCRQAYIEASAYIYTLNTFSFDGRTSFDRWIKNRPLGQRRIVTSVNMPADYWYSYRRGLRKPFCQKLPNIQRIGVDLSVAVYGRSSLDQDLKPMQEQIVKYIYEKEGRQVQVEWHNGVWGAIVLYKD